MKTSIAGAALTIVLAQACWQAVYAEESARVAVNNPAAPNTVAEQRHAHGLALQRRGDDKGAFVAFLDAAELGYPPAQRRLGEIYDSGNAAVVRDYEESIRWYQKAREGGEQIPPPVPHGNPLTGK